MNGARELFTRLFRILLLLVVLAGGAVFVVRQGTLRQLKSERNRLEQQLIQSSNHLETPMRAEAARSDSTNTDLSAAEQSELLRLRGEIGVLRRELGDETNRLPGLTGGELARATKGALPARAEVTAVVKALVAGGTNSITPGNHVFGDDPAPGVVKRLRVEFELGGQRGTNETTEGGSLEIPAGAEVVRAVYGDFPPLEPDKEILDVTEKLSGMVANGETSVKAANALVGFDPAPMIGKTLRVELRVDGAPVVLEANEGKTLDIPAGAQVIHADYGNLRGQKRSSPQ